MKKISYPPHGVFRSVNMITNRILSYYTFKYKGYTAYAELSTGDSPLDRDRKLFGVTVHASNGTNFNPSLSKCFDSLEKAKAYIFDIAEPDEA